ncbi:UDP-3-O-(3-hydroxymyristoyl)glucosamine N-acyltransferase [Crocinitomicaceae bacterium]|nr:UDP-3-O-(3-hydroxymyristoyl)glucosamine N-acyltransferase [Crocinitomicaceae bacterium]MDC1266409.1 UDP-3-O-(3-hydroxymyristoyl)glucosamine N-acyltransferase [Crocinitomicaceae bacterium]
MEFSAEQIAGILNGDIQGNPNIVVNDLSKIEEGKTGTLSFLSNPKYEEYIYNTESSICIVNKTFEPQKELPKTLTLVKVDDAYACFAKLLEMYNQLYQKESGIEDPSFISKEATIGKNCHVGAFCYIAKNVTLEDNVTLYPNAYIGENVTIKSGTKIYPNVTVYHDCKIGANCIIHSGTVIGSDGFGFAPNEKGEFQKIPQIGNVQIEDNVEIGSNVSIDRATMGSTFIRKGVKIDNLCQIAHNVDVDENSAMAAQVGIAGSSKIGKNVLIGGQAGISGHLKIADQTKIVAQSGIPSTVKKAQTLMGTPGIPIDDFKKSYFGFRKLPYLLKKVQELEQKIESLTK